MNQPALPPKAKEQVSSDYQASLGYYQPIADDMMKTLAGVYARLWKIERNFSQTLAKEKLLLQTRSLLVCIENYCLNGVAQNKLALSELVNRMMRLQDSLFFASTRRNTEEIIRIANAVEEAVRFAEASMAWNNETSLDEEAA